MNSHITKRKIYYLLDLHKTCLHVIKYDVNTIHNYCKFINVELNRHFSVEEQQQLKMFHFNCDTLGQFAYGDVEDISFDGLDDNNLYELFDKITCVDIDELTDDEYH